MVLEDAGSNYAASLHVLPVPGLLIRAVVPYRRGRASNNISPTISVAKESPMGSSGKAPTMAVWVISLVLFLIALAGHFRWVPVDQQLATWSWIIGFGLLLLACRVKGL
jgi:hypothetical protein